MRIFVARASGVIGRLLLPQLVQTGHEVIGMTRKEGQREAIEQTGAKALPTGSDDCSSALNIGRFF
ncbi:hypothetical protein [Paenibacillus tuaregi]|uniref:hypothetical protein n=1 Tax=Paenibacillus tuaregi TaxID=1816681 RepID=UPI000838A3E8|nr:hypothetical protein [Paenibacillus tuaregi]